MFSLLDGFEQEKNRGEFLVGIHVMFDIFVEENSSWGRRDDPTLQCTHGRVTEHDRECAGILMVLFDGNLT